MIDVKQFITDYFKLGVQVESFSISEIDGQELEQLLIEFQKRLLQQTSCSTLRESLVQMLNEAEKAIPAGYYVQQGVLSKAIQKVQALKCVIQMIDAQSPVA